jgi:prepilin-type N-terminal cleavage/methylation domain-containing protein
VGRRPGAGQCPRGQRPNGNRQSAIGDLGFTLIELLVVIGIIALLAAMIFPVTGAINRAKIRSRAKAELAKLETAIMAYHAKYGHYPPDNHPAGTPVIPELNLLYYELLGATASPANPPTYTTLDGSARISANALKNAFNAAGLVNCSRGAGDEAQVAVSFLRDLKAGQFFTLSSPQVAITCTVLGSGLEGPALNPAFQDAGSPPKKVNPWRYNSSAPTNNPNSYDLWLDVLVAGRTNRICNWSQTPLVVAY